MPKKPIEPTAVGALLAKSPRLARPDRVDATRWRAIVGDRVGDRTRAGSIRDGTLLVTVASPVWAQELTFLAPTILERLRAAGLPVKELRFRVGDVGDAPPPAPRAKEAPEPRKAALPEDLARRLANIADPALRAAIAEAAQYSLGRKPEPPTSRRPAPRAPRSDAGRSAPPDRAAPPPRGGPKGTGGRR